MVRFGGWDIAILASFREVQGLGLGHNSLICKLMFFISCNIYFKQFLKLFFLCKYSSLFLPNTPLFMDLKIII